ncbi:halomucin [Plakobranchus ocellatus]|uniref:Halomucin n=1 Tax=Plakobranchus ocellatus TaxID=259542 RepID=A0AAV3Y9A5_9GAST|nr:halomucin [Plakobranchus ocellatus]
MKTGSKTLVYMKDLLVSNFKTTAKSLGSWCPISDRVVVAKLVAKPLKLGIIQLYSPTSDSEDEEEKSLEIMIIRGHFNGNDGDERVDDVVGPNGIGTVNELGNSPFLVGHLIISQAEAQEFTKHHNIGSREQASACQPYFLALNYQSQPSDVHQAQSLQATIPPTLTAASTAAAVIAADAQDDNDDDYAQNDGGDDAQDDGGDDDAQDDGNDDDAQDDGDNDDAQDDGDHDDAQDDGDDNDAKNDGDDDDA